MKSETLNEVVRAAPPVSVGGLTLWGTPLSEWVLLLTIVYTVFLIVDKAFSIWPKIKAAWQKRGES